MTEQSFSNPWKTDRGPVIELVSTGSELLNGISANTHGRSFGRRLDPLGFSLARDTTVGDQAAAIAGALSDALSRAEVVLVSGGLGPTEDDLTRQVVANVLGTGLEESSAAVGWLEETYRARNLEFTASRRQQALCIRGAVPLRNAVGAAPGQRADAGSGRTVFLLPGPPPEFEAILDDHVMPWLRQRYPGVRRIPERLFFTAGIGESDIVSAIQHAGGLPSDVEIAYCAGPMQVELRLTSWNEDALTKAETLLDRLFSSFVYARERLQLEEAVGRLLLSKGRTVAVAESCTGGLLGQKITSVPGSSAWFVGGVIAYDDRIKTGFLGVSGEAIREHGAVSEAVARAMAKGVRSRTGADYGLSITGIAGPGGGTAQKPVGLVWFGLDGPDGLQAVQKKFPGDRGLIRERAARFALDLLRQTVSK